MKDLPTMADAQKVNKLEIPLILTKAGLACLRRAVKGPFRAQEGGTSYRSDVLNSGLRVVTTQTKIEQAQYAQPSTETMYQVVCRGKLRKPNIVDLGHGARGLWIGKEDAKHVMLYIHGGGFAISATHGHIIYQFDLQKKMRKEGHSFAVLSLAYTLAPGAMYPRQLIQAAMALQYLLEKQKRKPSSIMLAGDSAGGNLVAALLLHLANPHPSVPAIRLSCPLHAALLISPWISFATASQSFRSNAPSDYITTEAISHAIEAYMGSEFKDDSYSQPIKASIADWGKVVRGVIGEMMVWAGGGEILLDEISTFASMVEKALSEGEAGAGAGAGDSHRTLTGPENRLKFVVTEKASHEKMILDRFFLREKKGHGRVDVENWLKHLIT